MNDGAMQPYPLTVDKFLDHAAKWHADAEVVTARAGGASTRVSYAELRERALRVSGVLAGLGVAFGDRVATLAWNSQTHLETWYAIMGMGASCHTLNPRLTADVTASMLQKSGAKILIVSADLLPLAREIAANAPLRTILTIDEDAEPGIELAGAQPLESLLAAGRTDIAWGGFDENTECGLCFTSGTTGQPKGVAYSHRSTYLHTLRLLQADVMAMTAEDTALPVVPMFHASAWGMPFAAPAVGARLVLPGRHLDGASLARLIVSEGVTVASAVPTVWLGLVEHLEAEGGDVPSLKRIVVGGSPMPPALMARIERRLGVTVQTSWGMTELSPLGTIAPLGLADRDAGISGRPALGIDLLLTDAEGRPHEQQRGVEGHLRVRGASVVERYLGQAEKATDAEGWFDTGDLARIDARGNLVITGRSKDLIKSGGEWINPAEIEAIVAALPQVSLAAVIGRADSRWGERPILLVELRQGEDITDQQLLEPLRDRVASWWIPEEVVRLPKMPLAATGKVDKLHLRSQYGQA
ncbi:AMP-binding protein [Aquibium oceanicum]|uniref:AMP-dependent synthetase n=1 Tax=Aquibium oceanicum TaxID=1670800 RepID=A0A1L3SN31_9HYPH|nr:AMP-binding protein [Aquibium oceanicum]APH70761.1 AMP-dependent synthetase [Aquibium oceanicum]